MKVILEIQGWKKEIEISNPHVGAIDFPFLLTPEAKLIDDSGAVPKDERYYVYKFRFRGKVDSRGLRIYEEGI